MTQIIEVRETPIPADAWANYIPQIPELDSGSLNSLVDSFLAQGGKINAIPNGVTADAPATPLTFGRDDLYSPEEREAYNTRREAKRESRMRADDPAAIEAIRTHLPLAKDVSTLTKAVGLSESKLQRLLRDYFADEPMADRFRAQSCGQRVAGSDAALVREIREALRSGVVGISNVAKYCGSSFTKVAELNRRCKLGIPKGVGGFRKKPAAEGEGS